MANSSIQLSEKGQLRLRHALKDKEWNQMQLARQARVSRPTVSRLLNGHPVDPWTLRSVCDALGVEVDAVELKTAAAKEVGGYDLEELRELVAPDIERRCGTMRVLDMERPIEVGSIYTAVNVLERLTANLRCSEGELLGQITGGEAFSFDRFGLTRVRQKRVPGLEAMERNPALMVLGKPGAGKTTFLKYLAIACLSGKCMGDRIPIFVTLKEFIEAPEQPSILEFIADAWESCGVDKSLDVVTEVLKSGQGLVLLDGLDEVPPEDQNRALFEIRYLGDRYSESNIVATCRIAAKEYIFERFVEVEVADFSDQDIQQFVTNWFTAKQDLPKIKPLIERLESEKPVKELASSPLLLTLLCLVFGEAGDLPSNRAGLYKEGVDLLLKKWDGKRNIRRDVIYQKLSTQRKENLLGQLALATFQRGEYFFKQRVAEEQILTYIRNLPGAKEDPEALRVDSEQVLKAIEAQHGLLVERARGIYSFSHLTFHEYFTAKEIADQQDWGIVASHLTQTAWHEVVLLTAGSARDGNALVQHLKKNTDQLLSQDPKLQNFLMHTFTKTRQIQSPYKESSSRAFYFSLAQALDFDFTLSRSPTRDLNLTSGITEDFILSLARDEVFDLDFNLDFNLVSALDLALNLDRVLARAGDLDLTLTSALASSRQAGQEKLAQALQERHREIQPFRQLTDRKAKKEWWNKHGKSWTEKLRATAIKHRNIGHDWQFTKDQKQKLQQYYYANLLLVQCLNSDCYISREVRQEIDDTLLLPIAEIERYQAERS